MANIAVTRLLANDWTELEAPISCCSLTIQNANTALGFQFRSGGPDPIPELTVSPGHAIQLGNGSASLQPGDVIGEVKGGELIICVGIGIPMPIV